jgi:SAM-dependent methyltransferase
MTTTRPTSRGQIAGLRASYDIIAGEYAKRIYDELKDKPLDRQLLDRFASRVRGPGMVCDLGCGPAQIARYLHDRGVKTFGLDLSGGMLTEAKRLNPDIEFVQGSMLMLGLATNSLAGIAAFYSIIHNAPEQVVFALSEMLRVLRPGGLLLLTFHLGTDVIHETDLWGYSIDLDATFFQTKEMSGYLTSAGFHIEDAIERDPYPEVEYQSRRGYIAAIKSAQTS